MSSPPRPADLVPLADAARAVGRAPKTVRSWASAGRVGRWREDDADPSSRVLVSLGEVLLAAAALAEAGPVSGPVVAPPPPTGPAAPSSSAVAPVAAAGAPVAGPPTDGELVALRGEVAALRAALAAGREVGEARAEAARRVEAALDLALVAERARSAELASTVADLRERLDRAEAAAAGARAELDALRAAGGRSWWSRLLGGPVG
jgi:hypothetical protein